MSALTNLPLVPYSLDFDSKPYEEFKIERPYVEEKWLFEWRKNLGILRTRFLNTNE